ncbi:hypothetical protein BDR06DRAFT_885002, partial [Suillus hirtellus]
LTTKFPKFLTGLYMALCLQHIPFNHHLNHISKVPSPHCPHCPTVDDTISYYLLECPQYYHECHTLTCAVGHKASSMSFLLSDPSATPHLIRFIDAISRLRQTFGEVPLPHKPPD